MNKPPVDADIRHQALDINESFAVSAPAGSGKTGLLTQRVLNLLAHAEQPENILAMTFTRKAANEMHQRILEALLMAESGQQLSDNPHQQLTLDLAHKVLSRDNQRAWHLLQAPHRLRIQTIDSFCQYLVDQLPLRSGVHHALRSNENVEHLFKQCVREFFAYLDNPKLQRDMEILLGHVDNNLQKLENLLIELLKKRNQWLGVLYKSSNSDDATLVLQESMQRNVEDGLSLCTAAMQIYLPELIPLLSYALINNGDNEHADMLQSTDFVTAHFSEQLRAWKIIAEGLLTSNPNPDACNIRKTVDARNGFPAAKDKNSIEKRNRESMLALLKELAARNDVVEALRDIKALPEKFDAIIQQQPVISSLTRLLPLLVAQFQITCRDNGECDFDEIARAAVAALGEDQAPTDLALRLDYQIKHILVDEFQDTSLLQLNLLEKLTAGWQAGDGRTLFVVGDAMQSCYGFRDAKVGLFLRVRHQGIGNVTLQPLDLVVNFRSDAVIVDWVNRVFTQVFPKQDHLRRGAVSFRNAQSARGNTSDASVQLLGFNDELIQANKITALVQQHLSTSTTDTIAILARTRNQLPTILASLRDANIQWEAQDVDALRTQMAVVDLLSLTKAACDISDRISWLAILRAPWCGLDMQDLYRIANAKQKACVWEQLLLAEELNLSTAGTHIVNRIKTVFSHAFTNSHRQPFRQWLEGLWLALGGPASITNANERESAQHYFELVDQHCGTSANGTWSIENWDIFEQALDRLYATSPQPSRIQVMTLHKSKGLEFDVVILPHLEKASRNDTKDLLLWEDSVDDNGNINFLLSATAPHGETNPLYDYLWREQGIARELESARLLYVACTRAIKHLYLCACLPEDEKGKRKSPAAKSLLDKLWPTVGEEFMFDAQVINSTHAQNTDNDTNIPLSKILRLLPAREPVLFPIDPTLSPYRQAPYYQQDEQPPIDVLDNRLQRYCGTVIHKALEIACVTGWENFSIETQLPLWSVQLRQLGVSTNDIPVLLDIVKEALTLTLSDPKGQWILHNGYEGSVCEWQLSGMEAIVDRTSPREWVIDRSFIDQGVRWVIDYKSSIPEPGQDISDFLIQEASRYQPQLQTYHRAIVALEKGALDKGALEKGSLNTGAHNSRHPVRTALYFPRLAQFYPLQEQNLQ